MLDALFLAISSDSLAKRMQRPTAAERAWHRLPGVLLAASLLHRHIRRRPPRLLRQVFRPSRTAPHPDGLSAHQRLPDTPVFRVPYRNTHARATPAPAVVAGGVWREGIEKICMVTSNDADFVR
jgi:hypothetical protein